MHLRLIGAVLVLLGLVAAGTGVASATLWRPADETHAEALAPGATTLLVTDPGVLELVADTVTVRATGPQDSRIVAIVGREADVRAWVGTDPHARVTGLADAATLRTEPGQPVEPPVATPTAPAETPSDDDASPDDDDASSDDEGTASDEDGAESADDAEEAAGSEASTSPDPAGSDMWVAEVEGDTTVELGWQARPGRWSLLVASTGPEAGPPTLELTWPREVVTPWFRPGLWIGGSLVVLGAALIVLGWLRSRDRDEDWTAVEEAEAVAVPTGPLTRRQLRELEAARAAGRGRSASRRRAGADRGPRSEAAVPEQPVPEVESSPAEPAVESPPAEAATESSSVEPATERSSVEPAAVPETDDGVPPPFTPSQGARRPGGVVPHVPAGPAVPPAGWVPTSVTAPGPSTDGPTTTPPEAWSQPVWSPTQAQPGPQPQPEPEPRLEAEPEAQTGAQGQSWPVPGGAAPTASWPSVVAPGTSATTPGATAAPASRPAPGPDSAGQLSTRTTGTVPEATAPAAQPLPVREPGTAPEETAARRSRTGKFFTRRTRRERTGPDAQGGAEGPGAAADEAGPTAGPAAWLGAEPAPGAAGPAAPAGPPEAPGSSAQVTGSSARGAAAPGAAGPTSADAWRARWGFVEVPEPEVDPEGRGDEQEGGRP